MKNADLVRLHPTDIAEYIEELGAQEQAVTFITLPGYLEGDVFAYLNKQTQENILKSLGNKELAAVLSNMSPDDRTDFFEDFPDHLIKGAVALLSEEERKIALQLIGYVENSVGRMMTPYYIQVRQTWTVTHTLAHIKKHGKKAETLNFIYVVDDEQRLIDDIQIGKLLLADNDTTIAQLMDHQFVSLTSQMHKDDALVIFEKYDRAALPVISEHGILVGIVTFDDILDEIEKRDTEDIQKFGGVEALEEPYVETPLLEMVQKRAGWLVLLFLSEMLTTTAMAHYEHEIQKAVVLALFVPLIISSGGNSGSQAATLIIRAMALKEIALTDWWFVMRREILSGLLLGSILGVIGFLRILVFEYLGYSYGQFYIEIGLTVATALLGIVLWGTLIGSMIPFILKRLGLDPATSSAPFVATLVDVTGLILYFSVAAFFLSGKIL